MQGLLNKFSHKNWGELDTANNLLVLFLARETSTGNARQMFQILQICPSFKFSRLSISAANKLHHLYFLKWHFSSDQFSIQQHHFRRLVAMTVLCAVLLNDVNSLVERRSCLVCLALILSRTRTVLMWSGGSKILVEITSYTKRIFNILQIF